MSYYPYYPYQQMPPMQYPYVQQAQQPVQTPSPLGVITVKDVEEAKKYAQAPNTSLAFITEDHKQAYIKTTGSSLLEAPKFETFISQQTEDKPKEPTVADMVQAMMIQMNELRNEVRQLREVQNARPVRFDAEHGEPVPAVRPQPDAVYVPAQPATSPEYRPNARPQWGNTVPDAARNDDPRTVQFAQSNV